MGILDSSRLHGAIVIACFAGRAFGAQDALETPSDVDLLVDDVWDSAPSSDAVVGEGELEISLEAARAIALTNDLSLRGAEELVKAAQYRELGSWGAFDWLFTASGSLGEAEADASNIFDAGATSIETSTQDLSFGFERAFTSGSLLNLSFSHNNTRTNSFFNLYDTANSDILTAAYTRPLMRGAGREYATSMQKAAGLRWQREREAYRLARQQLLLQVEFKYWDLVLAERQIVVAGSALDLAIEQLERDRRRREAGVATEVEVIQDEATVARRIEGVLFAETALRSCVDSLRSTLFPGVGEEGWSVKLVTITGIPQPAEGEGELDWSTEIQAALANRGEVRMASLDVDISSLMHERTVSERRPFLDILVQVSSQGYDESVGSSLEETLGYEFPALTAGLNFQLPMSNTALNNEERAARAELRGTRVALDAIRSQVAAELREALRQVRYQAEASRAASKSREAAERLMEAERARYEQGLATNFQVLEFQQALVEARYAEHVVQASYGKALAALEGARGVMSGAGAEPAGDEAP